MQTSADLELGLTGDHQRGLRLVTLVGSGDSFTSQWSTLYDLEADEQRPLELSMRQVYLHHLSSVGRFSLGVIPLVKEFVSGTSMDSDGWVRGARAVFYVPNGGELEGVTGAVDRINQPSAFQRPTRWNYHEIEWTQPWAEGFRTELSAMFLTRAHMLRSELRYRFLGPFSAQYEVSGELLIDYKVKRGAYDLMLQIKKSGFRLRVEYSNWGAVWAPRHSR